MLKNAKGGWAVAITILVSLWRSLSGTAPKDVKEIGDKVDEILTE